MPTLRLTETNLEQIGKKIALPKSGQVLYWDDRQPGFGVRVTPTTKVFIVQNRVDGRNRRVKIGAVGTISAEDAKRKAIEHIVTMNNGVDPNKKKASDKAKQKTLKDVFDDYLKRKKLRPNTQKLYSAGFKLTLSDWSKKTLEQITRDDVEKRYDKICTGWRAIEASHTRGNGEALASQAMRLLGQLFNFEIEVHDREIHNPVKRLSHVRRGWSKSNQRQTVVTDNELPLFYQSIKKLRHEHARDYMLLVLLTALRQQEAAGLEWDEINLDEKYLLIRKERTKNGIAHGLPLPGYLYELLARRKEQNKKDKSPFVFPGKGKSGHYIEPKMATAYISERLGKKITSHTMRHTFATVSQRLGIHSRLQSKLLNHIKPDVTQRYVHADISMLRDPMQKINEYFLDKMDVPQPERGNP